MNNKMQEFRCCFCLEITKNDDYPEDPCPNCNVGECTKCFTFIKPGSKICYGCGELNPKVEGSFVRVGSTASVYSGDSWARRNKSVHSDGIYEIWNTLREKEPNLQLRRKPDDGKEDPNAESRAGREFVSALRRKDDGTLEIVKDSN